jgi:hypothetical protein
MKPWLRALIGFALAYAVLFVVPMLPIREFIFSRVLDANSDFQVAQRLWNLYDDARRVFSSGYVAGLVAATFAWPLGFLARAVMRARLRAGYGDRLESLSRFVKDRSRLALLATSVPSMAWAVMMARFIWRYSFSHSWDSMLPSLVLPTALVFIGQTFATWRAVKAFTAPLRSATEASGETITAEGFTFDAVAVTPETMGAVGALAAITAVMFALVFALPTTVLAHNHLFQASLISYLIAAIGGAALFQRTSRISVGLDGLHVSGSARSRFFGFADIDDARANGISLELLRQGRVVVRLQLHGEDAARRDALAERLREAIKRAKSQRDEPAIAFVKAASKAQLGHAAVGATSYRQVLPTRDKLWDAVEGAAIDADTRTAAAAALARDGDAADRTRLRIAAEHCAEPNVRKRIEALLEEEEEVEVARAPLRLRRT